MKMAFTQPCKNMPSVIVKNLVARNRNRARGQNEGKKKTRE
jgi:hypothetical protein